jgi:death-on-curing protein
MNSDPDFLTAEDVFEIHRDQLERYGGSPGLRDGSLLESALAQPASRFADRFLHADLYEMAAAYLFHLVLNHPFVDGNKRVAAVAAYAFLDLNDVELELTDEQFEEAVLKTVSGEWSKAILAETFRRNSRPF